LYVNSTSWVPSPVAVPEDETIFAIGDVHGYCDHLKAMHEAIHDLCTDNKHQAQIVHLGDYIDRGQDSKEVLDFLSSSNKAETKTICLPGNHDQYLIELIRSELDEDLDRYFLNNWYENGGVDTIKSLGVDGYGRLMEANNIAELSKRLIEALGKDNVDFLLSLDLCYKHGNFIFVHAGINPDKTLAAQDITDLLLIREPFLSSGDCWNHSFCVVHGHSIASPNIYPHRISTDAGVYVNGTLCAAQISELGIRFIGVAKDKNFPWGEKFNNEAIGLVWGTAQRLG